MKTQAYHSIRSILPKKYKMGLDRLKLGYNLVTLKNSYLVETGYVNSVIGNSLTNYNKESIPWMNYPIIEFLREKLNNDLIVFEYGSGFSTMFFAKRVKKVISIEYNKEWHTKVIELLDGKCDNVDIHYVPLNEKYAKAIKTFSENHKSDIVIIDGRERVKCAVNAYDYLSDRGILIFDDSERLKYKDGINFYKEKGFKSITFKGIKPTGFRTDQTTILYRTNNCLGI